MMRMAISFVGEAVVAVLVCLISLTSARRIGDSGFSIAASRSAAVVHEEGKNDQVL
jgi:hypothetical protein